MRCPICGKPVALDNPEMPFCGERCRTIDLGNWASEKYAFSSPVESSTDGEVVTRDVTGDSTRDNPHDEPKDAG